MKVEQYVMAYHVEQDRLRAMLPEGFSSLRPVLRINGEIREENGTETVYLELNTPVSAQGKRGWLNIAHWESPGAPFSYVREGKTLTFQSPFLTIRFTGEYPKYDPDHDGNKSAFSLEEAGGVLEYSMGRKIRMLLPDREN